MATLTIHGFAPSTYTRTARMAAIEKDVPHELVPLAYGEPTHFALHPFGKMPVLQHGDVTIFETLAILTYLDESFGSRQWFGNDTGERCEILTAATVFIDYAYRPVVHTKIEEETPDPGDMDIANRTFDWVEARLNGHDNIAGKPVSAADLLFAPMLAYHLGELGDGPLAKRPRLAAWMDRMASREAFQHTGAGQ